MSRIGNKVITLPAGVEVQNENSTVTVKGPKGSLQATFNKDITIDINGAEITLTRPNDTKFMKSIHGTTRALLNNMIVGVSEGFKKQLKMIGVGYRAQLQGKVLVINAGYSNPVEMAIPEGITVDVPKNTDITISGIDKQLVGEFSANVRKVRPPEPYLGKGIRYVDEYVRRKEGKTAK